ncbi:MAG: DUF1800 domain-containing protein [Saprospiraceae bacterium]
MANLQLYIPSAEKPWDKKRVMHFLRRLGMGGNLTSINQALAAEPLTFIENNLLAIKNRPLPTPPVWANYTTADYDNLNDPDLPSTHRTALMDDIFTDMINDGLRSKLLLFWHNHFVAELEVYLCNRYLWNYYNLLLKHCLGNFKNFVTEIGKSPAMLVYLNGNLNEVGRPNENYARELMELFTMGENNGYTQFDVVEVARSLTGYKCNQYTCVDVTFSSSKFDKNNKTIFGLTGNWNYDDVHNLIFTERKNQVAYYICSKLYAHFVYQKPDEEFVVALANLFISSNWELLPVMKAIFQSEHFFNDEFIGANIKSPMDCFVELSRATGITAANLKDRFSTWRYGTANLGMELWDPINVAGWPGYHEWINENTLTQRWNYCKDFVTTFTNTTNRETLRNLAISLVESKINDPDFITRKITEHFIGRDISDEQHQTAVLYLKGDIPENYFEDGSWNLNWNEAPFQVGNLIVYLTRLPEFQLS